MHLHAAPSGSGANRTQSVLRFSLVATLAYVAVTFVAGLRAHSLALLSEAGLPGRPWYKHTIFAPGELTGYAAQALPGVNEALDDRDRERAVQQLAVLTQALDRAARILDSAR